MALVKFVNNQPPYLNADNLNNNFEELENNQNVTDEKVGNLSELETTNKENLVGAINSIVESGSNENGYYTKFSDGTMICRNSLEVPGGEWSSMSGGGYNLTKSNVATFPQPFIDNDISLNVNTVYPQTSGIYALIGNMRKNSIGIETINFYRFSGANSANNIQIDYIAIGKWK